MPALLVEGSAGAFEADGAALHPAAREKRSEAWREMLSRAALVRFMVPGKRRTGRRLTPLAQGVQEPLKRTTRYPSGSSNVTPPRSQ